MDFKRLCEVFIATVERNQDLTSSYFTEHLSIMEAVRPPKRRGTCTQLYVSRKHITVFFVTITTRTRLPICVSKQLPLRLIKHHPKNIFWGRVGTALCIFQIQLHGRDALFLRKEPLVLNE
jgi:hypothetical protein